ncbi:hypothetical protein CHARACLAT_004231 [Characodon lateralis]|uniref:Uncharacterized protein n=1 Tax=Characodon lateralis TaxID=208331 RepID=A0ABU7D6X4_9TELE|nr:hypothetical protein [Characodon lateralis]
MGTRDGEVSLGTGQQCLYIPLHFLGIFYLCWGGRGNVREAKDSPAAPWSHALQTTVKVLILDVKIWSL